MVDISTRAVPQSWFGRLILISASGMPTLSLKVNQNVGKGAYIVVILVRRALQVAWKEALIDGRNSRLESGGTCPRAKPGPLAHM